MPPSDAGSTVLVVSAQRALTKKLLGLIEEALPGFQTASEATGVDGLNRIYRNPPALVILDSALPDISGVQIGRVLKHDPTLQRLPVLLLTRESGREVARFSELSLIADAILEEKSINEDFTENIKMLADLFRGLDSAERHQLILMRDAAVETYATSRLIQLHDQAITESAAMKGFNKLFERVPNKNILHHMLFALLENILDYDVAGVFFNDKTREARSITYHMPHNFIVKETQFNDWTHDILDGLKADSDDPWNFNTYRNEVITPQFMDEPGKTVALKHRSVYPFYIENRLVGALVLFNRKEVHYDIIFPFPLLLRELSALMRVRHYYSEAEMFSISDALTGLYSHQFFTTTLEREIRQSKRHQGPVTVAVLSLDDFQGLNAQGGHEMGDQAMKQLAAIILRTARSIDVFARAGSRKIVGLLPNTDPENARIPLARIQQDILAEPLKWHGQEIPLSISVGVAGLNEAVASSGQLIALAEQALEKAASGGHNSLQLL